MKIKFVPNNLEIDVNPSKSLMQLAWDHNIPIKSICKGMPNCAECRVKIVDGESNITPPSKAELSLIGNSYYLDGRRLSCQVRCFGPVTVDITEQLERDETQHKKIRGFKAHKEYESKAVLDTMILSDKPNKEE